MRVETPDGQDSGSAHVLGHAASFAALAGRWFFGGALAALVIALMLATAPRLDQLGAYRLSVVVRKDGSLELPVSAQSAGEEYAVHAPVFGGRTSLEADGADIVNRASAVLGGFGFNSRIVFAPLGPGSMTSNARLRLITQDDHGRIGVGPVYGAPLPIAELALAAQIRWAQRIQLLSIAVGVAAAFVYMMRLGRQKVDEGALPIVALSYIVVAQALAKHGDVGAAFGRYIAGAEYILAIWAAFAVAGVAAAWRAPPRGATGRVSLFEGGLLSAATLCVLFQLDRGIVAWLPATFAGPAIVLALGRASVGLSARHLSWPMIWKFNAVTVAACSVAASLARAADPHRWAQSFELVTVQSLGGLPLLLAALAAHAASTLADRRESVVRLKSDYAAQAAALAKANAALEEQARQRALLEERSRITRDMHDGIGGRLLSLLVRVRTGTLDLNDVENEVQGSLNDLRLIVDSLDTAGETLSAALGEFRARAAHELKGSAIRLTWTEVEGALDGVALQPDATLNIFRILQEAIANVVRHAGASSVDICIDRDGEAEALRITIADDGGGMAPDARANGGKGLKYMETRARQLNGRLDIGNADAGWRVALVIPLAGLQDASGSSSRPS